MDMCVKSTVECLLFVRKYRAPPLPGRPHSHGAKKNKTKEVRDSVFEWA